MLQLEKVEVRQGPFVLRADLEVPRGKRVALMGASGSGKSTLLSVLAGFTLPDAGRVWIDGVDMSRRVVAERPMSILFQDGNVFPHLPVFQNVALGVEPSLKLHWEDQSRVAQALDAVGLQGMETRMPAALSGGQQSRVALARLLLRDQPIALLDEPFAALDPGLRREMLDLVGDLARTKDLTLIMVTHDLRDAERLCDHLILLDAGHVSLDEPLATAIERAPPPLQPWI